MPALPPGKTEWTHVWSQTCYLLQVAAGQSSAAAADLILRQNVLKPGESVTIPVSAVVGQMPFPDFRGDPGTYRFHIPLSVHLLRIYEPASTENSVSEPFTVLPAT